MMRRSLSWTTTLLAVGAVVLAACGDDDVVTAPGTQPPTTAPTSEPAGSGIEHPTGADDVVLSYDVSGGFVPSGAAFATVPAVVVTGDGTVHSLGPQTLQYPGPLLPNVLTRHLDDDGLATLLGAADDAGLIGRDTSSSPDNIADAPTTTLTITAGGGTWEHVHYALGLDGGSNGESDPDRVAVATFTEQLTDLATLVGAEHLGAEAPADLDRFAVAALDPASGGDPELPQEPATWPPSGPELAGLVQGCAEVDGAEWSELFGKANEFTPFVTPSGDEFRGTVRPLYPGVPGCS